MAWDGESLVTTAEVVEQVGGPSVALLDKLLPLIGNMGLGVIVRAPVPEGTERLPLVNMDSESAERAMSAQAEFLKAVVTPPTFAVAVNYAPDGSWRTRWYQQGGPGVHRTWTGRTRFRQILR